MSFRYKKDYGVITGIYNVKPDNPPGLEFNYDWRLCYEVEYQSDDFIDYVPLSEFEDKKYILSDMYICLTWKVNYIKIGDVELNKIYNEDCLVGMKQIPDKSIDLVVTDPPYLMNYRSNRRVVKEKFDYISNDHDSKWLITEYINECYRVMKDNTAIYMFCSWHHIDFFKQEFESKFKLKNLIVWNKNNHGSGDLKGAYAPKHELILFGHKGRPLLQNKRIPDVIDCDKVSSSKLTHPTEKPVELLNKFILNSSKENDVILDGFIGTCATAISCIANNRNYIGFELESENVHIGNERIRNFKQNT